MNLHVALDLAAFVALVIGTTVGMFLWATGRHEWGRRCATRLERARAHRLRWLATCEDALDEYARVRADHHRWLAAKLNQPLVYADAPTLYEHFRVAWCAQYGTPEQWRPGTWESNGALDELYERTRQLRNELVQRGILDVRAR